MKNKEQVDNLVVMIKEMRQDMLNGNIKPSAYNDSTTALIAAYDALLHNLIEEKEAA